MKHMSTNAWLRAGLMGATLLCPSLVSASTADSVWHCSRVTQAIAPNDVTADEDHFQLASSGLNKEAIGISIVDLMQIYAGRSVWVNGRRLAACFMAGETALASQALKSLGLNTSFMQLLARSSAIVPSHLYRVTDEKGMKACISRHFPAVGYMSQQVHEDRITPCF